VILFCLFGDFLGIFWGFLKIGIWGFFGDGFFLFLGISNPTYLATQS
jgi:hypothetical protein